jgi:hypothetical protein
MGEGGGGEAVHYWWCGILMCVLCEDDDLRNYEYTIFVVLRYLKFRFPELI